MYMCFEGNTGRTQISGCQHFRSSIVPITPEKSDFGPSSMGENIDFSESWGDRQRDVGSFDLAEGSDDERDDRDAVGRDQESDDDQSTSKNNNSSATTESDAAAAARKAEKLSKKKRKFSEMKAKRQALHAEEAANDTAETANLSGQPASDSAKGLSLSPEQQALALNNAFPEAKFDFEAENFVSLSANNPQTASMVCPFAQCIMQAIPSFKRMLKNKSSAPSSSSASSSSSELPHGAPVVLVVCSSAVRAADVINMLSKQFHCIIAKLFAKHFKLQEQVEFLNTQTSYIAVGTPNRIAKLIEYGALQLSHTQVVLLDTWADSKAFNLLTLPDIRKDVIDLLTTWIVPRIQQNAVLMKLCFVPMSASKPGNNNRNNNSNNQSNKNKQDQNRHSDKDKYHHPKKIHKSK
jgi:superfamily II DNA/RNA helicase